MSGFFIIFYVTFDPMRAPDASCPVKARCGETDGDRMRKMDAVTFLMVVLNIFG